MLAEDGVRDWECSIVKVIESFLLSYAIHHGSYGYYCYSKGEVIRSHTWKSQYDNPRELRK